MNVRRLIVMILTVCMIVTYMPITGYVYADETDNDQETGSEAIGSADVSMPTNNGSDDPADIPDTEEKAAIRALSGEAQREALDEYLDSETAENDIIEAESGLDYNTYDLGENTRAKVFFSYPVRYEDENGDLVEIEPELIETDAKDTSAPFGYSHENKTGLYKTYIPTSLSLNTPILLENDIYSFTMAPTSLDVADADVSVEDVKATYGSDEDAIKLEYISQNDGIKENIILNERPTSNEITFKLTFDNMSYSLDPNGHGITFYDEETDDIVMGIESPFMNDATGGAYSEDLEYEMIDPEEGDNTYTLKLKISDKYLDDPDRVYPVTIDPTATWVGTSEVRDSYVISSYPTTNFYSSSTKVMPSGNGTQGVHRTYIHILNLKNELIGANISNASFDIYETGGGKSGKYVRIYRITEDWTNSTVTWNNKPDIASGYIDSITTNGTANHQMSYDVTSWVSRVVSEEVHNYGLCLRNKTETGTTYTEFYGTRTGATSYRPILTVVYTADTPSIASSVSVSTNPSVVGNSFKVKWSGITANKLSQIQYKVAKCSSDWTVTNDNYVSYTRLTSGKSSGAVTVPNSGSFPTGYYKVYVRGVSKMGTNGSSKSAKIRIVTDKPTTPATVTVNSSSMFEGDGNTVAWTGVTADSLDHIEYRIASYDSNWNLVNKYYVAYTRIKGAVSSGSASIPDISSFPAGKYKIFIRGVSESNINGNGKGVKITIKKDASPTIGSISFRKGDDPVTTYTTTGNITVDVKDIADDRSLSGRTASYTIKKDNTQVGSGTAALTAVSGKYNATFTIPSTLIEDTADYSVEVSVTDIKGNPATLAKTLKIDNIKPTVNITSPANGDVLTGEVFLSVDAADNKSLYDMKIVLIDQNENETELTGSQGVYNFNTTLYPDGVYTIKALAWDIAGNESEHTNSSGHIAQISVTLYNPPPTPTLELDRYFGSSQDSIGVRWSYVSGDSSASKVNKLQIALVSEGTSVSDSDFTDFVTIDADRSGNSTYDPSNLTEGRYNVYLRSVTLAGNACTPRSVTYVVDETQPEVVLDNLSEAGTDTLGKLVIRGEISDDYLSGYKIYISSDSGTNYSEIYSYDDIQNTNIISGILGTVDLSDDTVYPEDSSVIVKIDACDEKGNHNIQLRTVTKSAIVCDDPDFEIQKDQDGEITVTDDTAVFLLKDLSDQTYAPNDPIWIIDGIIMTSDQTGALNLSGLSDYTLHTIAVYDKDQSGNIFYGTSTIETILDGEDIDPRQESTVDITNGEISLATNETTGELIADILNTDEAISIKIDSNEVIPQGSSAVYYLSVNNGNYVQVSKGIEILLTEAPFSLDSILGNQIKLKVVLDKGTAQSSPVVTDISATVRKPQNDTFSMNIMGGYEVSNVTAVSQLNYKILVKWQPPSGIGANDDITYEIYRSRSADFSENDTVLMQSGLTECYWYDSYNIVNEGESVSGQTDPNDISGVTFYYRVKTVRTANSSTRISRGVDSPRADIVALDEYSKRLGIKDYWGYSELDVGAGTGYVEQSKGNFVYQETDCYVKGKVLDLEMTRTYNSMSTGTTALGLGWDFSFNPILLEIFDGYGDNKGMLFKDGSGTIYTFLNIPNEEGVDEKTETIGGVDVVTSIETHYKSPYGVYIHLRKIETLDKDDIDLDGDTSEVIDVHYVIETLSKDTYTFNRSSQITSYEDPNGNIVLYTYTEDGKLQEAENRNGKSEQSINASGSTKRSRIQFSYFESSEGNPALIKYVTMPNGQKVRYTYSSDNRLISCSLYGAGDGTESSITGTPVLSTNYVYSNPNNGAVSMITVTDPNGYESEIEYYQGNANNVGKCHKVTDPDSGCQEFLYDASNQTIEKTFVKRNNVLTEIGCSTVRYNSDGNITYSEDIEGSVIETQYALGLEVREESEVDQYTILDSGIIQHSIETVSTRTEYEDIPDNNTIASKIADTTGNVTSSTDIEGNTTTFQYSASGDANRENPTSIVTTPPAYSDTADGSVEASDDGTMQESFEYDSNGNPTRIIDDDTGEEIIYTYDQYGQVISETMQITEGNKTIVTSISTYSYDDQGNVTSESSSNGSSPQSTDRYMYDDFGRLTMEMNAGGYVTAHFYDALDREIRTVYYTDQYSSFNDVSVSDGNVYEEWQYDLNGNLIRERDRGGKETVYTYDNMDRITSKTVSLNGTNKTWTYTYSYEDVSLNFNSGSITVSNAYVTTVTDPDNVVTSKTFEDKAGNTVKTIENGESTAFRYNRDGELIEMFVIGMATGSTEADPSYGRTVISTYNKYGNVTASIINPGWNGESYYIADGTIVYRYKYDTMGNLLKMKDPLGRSVKYSYDQNGRVISTKTPSSDPTDPGTKETLVGYDIPVSNGNTVTLVRNAMQQYTETEEDPNGNVVRITDHGTVNDSKKIEVTFTYDAIGNLISETDGNGTRYYSYDDMDNLVRSVSEGTLTEPTDYCDYTYDCFGMMTSRKDYSDGSFDRISLYRYDELKRLRKYYEGETEYQEDSLVDWTEYDYDIEDNLTRITYPSMPSIDYVAYTYGEYNRVSSISIKEKNSQSIFTAREYTYDCNGRVSSLNDYLSSSSYLKKDYSYDQFGRCTEIQVTDNGNVSDVLEHCVYTYDKCGNILTEEMLNAGAYDALGNSSYDLEHFSTDGTYHVKRYYTYNDLDELINVQENAVSGTNDETLIHDITYTYDEIGNRVSEEKDGVLSTYNYDSDGLNLLETVVKETTEDMSLTTTYSYDEAGNVTEVIDEEKDTITEYTYDSQGRLLTATVTAGINDPVVTENIYDGAGYRIAKKVGNTTTHYFVVSGAVLFTWETVEGSNASTVTSENAAGIDGQIFRTKRSDGNWYVYSNDLRRSVTGIADSSGKYLLAVFYDVYGEPEVWGKGVIYNEIYYTGAIYDDTTGLYYLSSRYYDPATGRFTSMDSVRGNAADPLSLNLFIYCEGNPVKYTDAEGEYPVVIIGAVIGGVIGAGSELLSQALSGQKINGWKVLISAGAGAITGAFATTGAGIFASAVVDFLTGSAEDVGHQLCEGTSAKKINWKRAVNQGTKAAVTGAFCTATSKALSKNSKKINFKNENKKLKDSFNHRKKRIETRKTVLKREKVSKAKNPNPKKIVKTKAQRLKTKWRKFNQAYKIDKSARKSIKKVSRYIAVNQATPKLAQNLYKYTTIKPKPIAKRPAVRKPVVKPASRSVNIRMMV